MKYAVIVEKSRSTYSGYVPDLPVILVTGKTFRQTESRARKAIALYLEELQASGQRPPRPTTRVTEIEVMP